MMLTSTSSRWLYRNGPPLRLFAPALSAVLVLVAMVVPWLKEPFGESYAGWNLPIYIGWGFHSRFFNYGLLCAGAASYALLVACAHEAILKRLDGRLRLLAKRYVQDCYGWAGCFCLMPFCIFLLQYLVSDLHGIDLLAQHKMQMLLIQQHLGYGLLSQRLPISPFTIDVSSINGRFALLANQASFGMLLPAVAAGILFSYRLPPQIESTAVITYQRRRRVERGVFALIALFLLCLFGRVPAAALCESLARAYLDAGNYNQASVWLDKTLALNPDIDQLTYYHVERGQIRYFLQHDELSDESMSYLALTEYQQGNYQAAYQDLLGVWNFHRATPWVVNEMDLILERYAESKRPLGNPIDLLDAEFTSSLEDSSSLPPLQLLIQVDPGNIFGHYVTGRINYDLHAYIDCTTQMAIVNQLSTNRDIQSSAYTYMGLSEAGQGDYVETRIFLLKAVALDPNYYNNTAREELSGLH